MSDLVKNSNIENAPQINVGLSDLQVKDRIELGLVNKTNKKYSKSYFSILSNNLFTFFNFLGLASFIALVSTGAKINQFIFVFFYIANITIGIIQEIRAKKCVDKLSIVANKPIKVIRNGLETLIPTTDIVLDDIIRLGIGNQVPTDSIIVEGEVEVNESLLTGESVAVKKQIGDLLLAGSFITSGICKVKAERVGKENYIEKLSEKAKAYKKPNSEIMRSLKKIIKFVGIAILPIAIALVAKSLALNNDVPTAILASATVIIGMIPAGMILLTSVALAVGIVKLARHNTLVQDLYSLEMLARVDTLCFDKTGTITDGNMTVSEFINLSDTDSDQIKSVLSSMIASLNDENQTAFALKDYFGSNLTHQAIATLPFNSTRKLCAVEFEQIGTFAFGAPEFVLCENNYDKVKNIINENTSKGLRVLAVANTNESLNGDNVPTSFSPIALIVISDNIRNDAIDTVKWFKENDVNVKVISGDNALTVSEVAKRAGIENADKYISLDGMTDEEVASVANKYTVFGRVNPEQKAILVKAIRADGHVVAMTGDGVNDILAMKEADCAVSVASGSDAAKNVAHLVLLDSNFNSMPKIVYEGRRVINNVQDSASLFLMKTLFTMLMAIITLVVPYMTTYPFVASQMNPLEFLIIGVPAFFLSLRPNDARVSGKFISQVIKKSLPCALLMLFGVIVIEVIKAIDGTNQDLYTSMQVYTILLAGIINLFYACRPFRSYSKTIFSLSAIVVFAIIFLSMFNLFPLFNSFFLYVPLLPFKECLVKIITVFAVFILDIPLSIILQKLFSKINFDKIFKK